MPYYGDGTAQPKRPSTVGMNAKLADLDKNSVRPLVVMQLVQLGADHPIADSRRFTSLPTATSELFLAVL